MIDASAAKGIEITKLYVFGTTTPDPDDYNLHIRGNEECGFED